MLRAIKISEAAYDLLYDEAYARRMKLTNLLDHIVLDLYKPDEDADSRRRVPVKRRTIRRPVNI
jgi:hypothetical protein